jgi:hypothetical protein
MAEWRWGGYHGVLDLMLAFWDNPFFQGYAQKEYIEKAAGIRRTFAPFS